MGNRADRKRARERRRQFGCTRTARVARMNALFRQFCQDNAISFAPERVFIAVPVRESTLDYLPGDARLTAGPGVRLSVYWPDGNVVTAKG